MITIAPMIDQVHLFTGIQAATLVALWIIKSTAASLIFPLMVSLRQTVARLFYTKKLSSGACYGGIPEGDGLLSFFVQSEGSFLS